MERITSEIDFGDNLKSSLGHSLWFSLRNNAVNSGYWSNLNGSTNRTRFHMLWSSLRGSLSDNILSNLNE